MTVKKKHSRYDDSFYKLAAGVDKALKASFDGTTQKQQVEKLLKLEEKFKDTVISSPQGTAIYKKFVSHIVIANGNRLTANPFFRETRKIFTTQISPALEKGDWKSLQKHKINYKMAVFIRENWRAEFPAELQQLFQEISAARSALVTNNMPLAINRAKLFYSKVPKSHLDLLDMISLCTAGLCVGIDKWSDTEYSRVFLSVCIGRMTANLMEAYNATTIRFTPEQEKLLYRANRAKAHGRLDDVTSITAAVNLSLAEDSIETGKDIQIVSEEEINNILSAANVVSIDSPLDSDDESPASHLANTATNDLSPEDRVIKKELLTKIFFTVDKMDLMTVKVLKLKGLLE